MTAAGRAPSRFWRGIGLMVLVVGPLLVLGAGVAAALEVATRQLVVGAGFAAMGWALRRGGKA
mgnify:FL=1